MEFEWNDAKRQSNLVKHNVDLLEAALIFEGSILKLVDTRRDYGETRFKCIGFVDGECFVVIQTERNGVIRLISAWRGSQRDKRKYQESIPG